MTSKNIHIKYLKSFGSERLRDYYVRLGIFCAETGLDLPYEEELNLEDYLEKHNIWYTLYLW